jgi:DNA-binding NarL/FixJ family response regulator
MIQPPITIAIVEDNDNLRRGLVELVNCSEGFTCVGAWANAEDIVLRIRCTLPQVVLMDIDLNSRINGIEATLLLKAAFPDLNIVMQTVFEDSDLVFQAIQAGASGYLLKNTSPTKLLEGLADAAQGYAAITPSIAHKIIGWLPKTLPMTAKQDPSVSLLSERQKDVLNGIIAGKNYKSIAEELCISGDTVRFHIKKIYELLHVHSKYELIMLFKK